MHKEINQESNGLEEILIHSTAVEIRIPMVH